MARQSKNKLMIIIVMAKLLVNNAEMIATWLRLTTTTAAKLRFHSGTCGRGWHVDLHHRLQGDAGWTTWLLSLRDLRSQTLGHCCADVQVMYIKTQNRHGNRALNSVLTKEPEKCSVSIKGRREVDFVS